MGPNPHVVHLGQPGARVVLGAGEGERRVLADSTDRWIEQDDTVLDPRQVRQAVALERFEQRQRHRMVVHVDRFGADVGRVAAGWPSLDSFASIHFLRVLWVDTPCWPLRVRRSHAFLLDGTSASSPTVASRPHATLRSSGCPERYDVEEDAMAQTSNVTPDVEAAVERIKQTSERVLALSKENGLVWLEAYEKMLNGVLKLEEDTAKDLGPDWVETLVSTQADLMRETSQAYLGAVKDRLK